MVGWRCSDHSEMTGGKIVEKSHEQLSTVVSLYHMKVFI